ncbi:MULTISPECIES: hypothetical protein [Streptomyces]|uniref:hypothetical protein n=1 Tax=Streptomyces TaxID=1883 RepID=UPI0004BF52E4|nr:MULTISPECIES: hypothetical protein [Streptomyces]
MDNSSSTHPADGTATAATTAEYDRLIARHHAMRLRRRLLAPSAHRPTGRRVHLFVGARDRADLYDWQDLAELVLHKPWLSLTPVTAGRLADAVAAAGDWRDHLACVSGPVGMVSSVRSRLVATGVPLGQVRYDHAWQR